MCDGGGFLQQQRGETNTRVSGNSARFSRKLCGNEVADWQHLLTGLAVRETKKQNKGVWFWKSCFCLGKRGVILGLRKSILLLLLLRLLWCVCLFVCLLIGKVR